MMWAILHTYFFWRAVFRGPKYFMRYQIRRQIRRALYRRF
jgi:hypothetical protein